MYPTHIPAGVSASQNMREAYAQRQYFINGGDAFLMSWFYRKVRNRGDWDYKQHGKEFEAFGNFNFGACGTAAGISAQVLLRGAGWAQGRAGSSQESFGVWWGAAPYGDDPKDQHWIKVGIDYAKSMGY